MTSIDNVNDVAPRIQATALPLQDEFDFPFPIFQDADLKVYVDGIMQTLTTHYVVTGAGDDTGGTVTLVDSLVGGEIVTIFRDTVIERLTDFQQTGPFFANAVNDEFDKGTIIMQELRAAIDRALHLPPQDNAVPMELANVDTRKGKYLFFSPSDGSIEYALSIGNTTISNSVIGQLLYPQSNAEAAVGLVPIRYLPYGDVRRAVVGDGVADDTAALNLMADAARLSTGYLIFQDEARCKVSGTIDFTGLTVHAAASRYVHIQAVAGMTDPVIHTEGDLTVIGLRVDGAGTGASGQSGDILSITADSPDFPYIVQASNLTLTNARRDAVHIERGGYTSFRACRVLGAGRHAFYSFGTDFAGNSTTTIETGGACQWSSCPNEAGVYIANAVNHRFHGDIIEATIAAIKIRGDNRAHSFLGVYAENTNGLFFDWTGAAGIGIVVLGCFGGNGSIAYNPLYQSQFIPLKGNSNLSVPPAAPDELGYIPLLSDEVVRGVADADDFTPTTAAGASPMAITLSQPGEWEVWAEMQTRASAGSPTLAGASLAITDSATPSSVTGIQDGTNSSFLVATDFQRTVPSASCRLKARDDYVVTSAPVTLTVRCFLDFTGGGTSVAVRVKLVARRRVA